MASARCERFNLVFEKYKKGECKLEDVITFVDRLEEEEKEIIHAYNEYNQEPAGWIDDVDYSLSGVPDAIKNRYYMITQYRNIFPGKCLAPMCSILKDKLELEPTNVVLVMMYEKAKGQLDEYVRNQNLSNLYKAIDERQGAESRIKRLKRELVEHEQHLHACIEEEERCKNLVS